MKRERRSIYVYMESCATYLVVIAILIYVGGKMHFKTITSVPRARTQVVNRGGISITEYGSKAGAARAGGGFVTIDEGRHATSVAVWAAPVDSPTPFRRANLAADEAKKIWGARRVYIKISYGGDVNTGVLVVAVISPDIWGSGFTER